MSIDSKAEPLSRAKAGGIVADVMRRLSGGRRLNWHVWLLPLAFGLNVLLGLGRDAVLAATFGATESLDALLLGISFVRTAGVLIAVAVSSAFIPVLVPLVTERRDDLIWEVTRRWGKQSGLILAVVTVVLVLGARPLAGVLGPGLSLDGRETLAASLVGLAGLTIVLGLSGLTKALADSYGRYLADPVLRAMMALGLIGGVLVLNGRLGVMSIVVGLVAGAVGGLLIQVAILAYRSRLWATWRRRRADAVPDVATPVNIPYANMLLLLGSAGTIQLQGILERAFATRLPAGSVVAFSLAIAIVSVPVTLLLPAMSSVLLPYFSRRETQTQFRFGLSGPQYGLMLIPFAVVTVLLWYGSGFLVRLLFLRGAFTEAAAAQTTIALQLLALSTVPYVLLTVFRQVLIARRHNRADLLILGLILLIKATLLYFFAVDYGLEGIAIISTAVTTIGAILYLTFLRLVAY